MRALVFLVALLVVSPAYADGNGECDEANGVWVCPLPKPSVTPRCTVFDKHLVCNAPVVVEPPRDSAKPINCGWRRRGYVCW